MEVESVDHFNIENELGGCSTMHEVPSIKVASTMADGIVTNQDLKRTKDENDVPNHKTHEIKQNGINEEKLSEETIKLDDDEGDLCRICRTPAESESPLYFPCACSGSIKYVHQECLLQWLNHSNARQCEVCKHPFAFSPVYARNAPARLPFKELLLGVASKAGRSAKFCIRLLLVLSIWFLFVPFTTYWMWRFTFIRNFAKAQRLFMSRCTPNLFLMDCLHGLLLSACIIFVFLAATSIREYFRHVRELNTNHDEARPHRNMRLPGVHGGVLILDEPPQDLRANHFGDLADHHVPEQERLAFEAGNILRLNAENVVPQLEIQAARLEARVEQILDAPDDVDIGEDVPFVELVGMEGPIYHLAENAIIVLASNAIFLGLVALIPFTLGRLVLSIASRIVTAINNVSVLVASIFTNYSSNSQFNINVINIETNDNTLQKPNNFDIKVERIVRNDTFYNAIVAPIINAATFIEHISGVGNTFNRVTGTMVFVLKLSDAATIVLGYAVLFIALSFYLGLIAFIRYIHGEPLAGGYINEVNGASLVAIAPSMARQIMSGIQFVGIIIKVVFLIIIELGLFPILCGWWLDICTMKMLDITILQRVSFFWTSPITSTIIHWLAGIVYMLQIGNFVNMICQVLRPRVLYFLRDPTNPNYNPFRDLVHDSLHKHVQRIFLSIAMYGSFVGMLIYVPVQMAIFVTPLMFPLNIRVSDPFTEVPIDMLFFHLCIPFAVEHFKPRATIKIALKQWFSFASQMLGLSRIFNLEQEDHVHRYENNQNWQQRMQLRERIAFHEAVQNPIIHPLAIVRVNDNYEGSTSPNNGITVNDDNERDITIEEHWREKFKFAMRIGLLLAAAWTSLLVVNTITIILPITIGRTIFAFFLQLPMIHGAKYNDIYAFNISCYVLWVVTTTIKYMVYYLQTHNLVVFIRQVLKWSTIVAKSLVLLFLWIVLTPLLIGLIFKLVAVLPLRVPMNESPILFLYHDWAFGLVILKIWTRLVMLGHCIPLTDESWRLKFEQVWIDGFSRLRGWWIFKEIILPILTRLILVLCVPYVLVHTFLPLFGYSWFINYAIDQFAWSGCFFLVFTWYGTIRLRKWCMDIHNAIRDDRYLIGRRLHNFIDRKRTLKQPVLSASIISIEETRSVAIQDETPSMSGITSINYGSKDALIEVEVASMAESLPIVSNVVSEGEGVGNTSRTLEVEAAIAGTSHCLVKAGVGLVLEDPREGCCSLHEENESLGTIVHSTSVPKAHVIIDSNNE